MEKTKKSHQQYQKWYDTHVEKEWDIQIFGAKPQKILVLEKAH